MATLWLIRDPLTSLDSVNTNKPSGPEVVGSYHTVGKPSKYGLVYVLPTLT